VSLYFCNAFVLFCRSVAFFFGIVTFLEEGKNHAFCSKDKYVSYISSLFFCRGAQEVLGLPIWDKRVDLTDAFNKVTETEAEVKVPVSGSLTKGTLFSWSTRPAVGADWTVDRLELEVESKKGYRLLVYDKTRENSSG
jgi:hypothetical protein